MTSEELMHLAIWQAQTARETEEVPIGCVIFHEPTNKIIGAGHNRRIISKDPTAHAEIVAIRRAGNTIRDWRLLDTILVVTLEPCAMCAGAIVNARIPKLIYGCSDPKAGAVRTLYQVCEDQRLNHRVEVTEGVLAVECASLLTDFFKTQRAMGKK